MNILIYTNVYLWEQHLSESLEIIKTHVDSGDKVFLLGCDMSLISCPPNFSHSAKICEKCIFQKKHLLSNLLKNEVTQIELELKQKQYLKKDFKNLQSFINYKYKNFLPVGELSLSTHTDFERDFYVNFSKIKNRLLSLANNSIALFERTIQVVEANNIDIIYAWNGRRHSDGPVLYAAKFLKKKNFFLIYLEVLQLLT